MASALATGAGASVASRVRSTYASSDEGRSTRRLAARRMAVTSWLTLA